MSQPDRRCLLDEVDGTRSQVHQEFQAHDQAPDNHDLALFTSSSQQQPLNVNMAFQPANYLNDTQSTFTADANTILELMESLGRNDSQLQPINDSYYQQQNTRLESARQGGTPGPKLPEFLYSHPARSTSSEDTNSTFVFPNPDCKYPVLLPLIPYLGSIMTIGQACQLLEVYFAQPSNSVFECASPYVLTPIFRRSSFLGCSRPRKTSPALLATMLWTASLTSDAKFLEEDSRARATICEALYQVCLDTLDIEDREKSKDRPTHKYVVPHWHSTTDGKSSWVAKSTDADIVLAFALIGIVISGGNTRRDCLKWWASAFALAKNLKLNMEVDETFPEFQSHDQQAKQFCGVKSNVVIGTDAYLSPDELLLEEFKEERRRIWWLLYIADRHLALSYNARLNILDTECRVYQPLDEETWQNLETKMKLNVLQRVFGPSTTFSGVGLFEYFLPLMSILGDVVEIHHLSCHPRFGSSTLVGLINQVGASLEDFEKSLIAFESSVVAGISGDNRNNSQSWSAKVNILKRLTIVYSKHILHVLHVLLHGRWDPISMLDGIDNWLPTESFVKCATQAIAAARTVSEILELDPELKFMPYIFGIYLLHGSFILPLFAERMDILDDVTIDQACETSIRAHEVCITTLNTEYQRDFRKVLCSTLNVMRGNVARNDEEHGSRRRELLSRFRWTRDGKGLAT